MTFDGDPYRVLGLPHGASLAEVKRAYRLLAKQFHPDSAGERALPRFLAIQAAYESLVTGRTPPIRRPTRSSPAAWEADPTRARATRDAYRRRGAGGPSGATAGRDDARTGGPTKSTGSTKSTGTRPGTNTGGGTAWTRTPPRDGPPGDRSRRRPGRKATLGSTSYDDARSPFEATWEGGTWYGASSGTYWTINPKEYADPRKHGPEYLARARRARRGAANGSTATNAPPPEGAASPTAAPPGDDARESPMGDAEPTARTARPASTTEAATARESELTGARTAVAGRAIVALVGWPPIGLAIVALLGELSGCGRFAASCGTEVVGAFGVATWLVQLVVVGVLFALPPLARAAAGGSIALLAASIPVAVFLSAIGGARDPATASVLLVGLLGVAWIVGVTIELAGGQATRSAFWRRVG